MLLVGPQQEIDRQGPALAAALSQRARDARDLAVERGRDQAAADAAPEPDPGRDQHRPEDPTGRQHQHGRRAARGLRQRARPATASARTWPAIPIARQRGQQVLDRGAAQGRADRDPILILVVLLVFRSPIAAGIPLVIAAGTVIMGFGILSLILDARRPRCGGAQRGVDARARARCRLLAAHRHALQIESRRRPSPPDRRPRSRPTPRAGRRTSPGMVLLAITFVAFFAVARLDPAFDGDRHDRRDGPEHGRRDPDRPGRDEPARPSREHVADRQARRPRRAA